MSYLSFSWPYNSFWNMTWTIQNTVSVMNEFGQESKLIIKRLTSWTDLWRIIILPWNVKSGQFLSELLSHMCCYRAFWEYWASHIGKKTPIIARTMCHFNWWQNLLLGVKLHLCAFGVNDSIMTSPILSEFPGASYKELSENPMNFWAP